MTISSLVRTVGPIIGNGGFSAFPFAFKVFATTELTLIATDSGVDRAPLVLGTDYSVVLNTDQNASPGGTITYRVASTITNIPTGTVINGTSNVANLQPTNLTNNGGFFPAVINASLDRLTILVQQLARIVNSALQFPVSDGVLSGVLPNKAARLGKLLAFDVATGLPIMSNQTLATIEAGSTAAAASAAAALADRLLADADVVLTHADVVLTHADVVLTHADVVTTGTNAGTATTQAGIATTQAGLATSAVSAVAPLWNYSSTITMADPGTGLMRFNSLTLASITQIALSALTGDTANPNVLSLLNSWDDSTNTAARGILLIRKQGTPATYLAFSINGAIVNNTTWVQVPVTYIGNAGTLTNLDKLYVGFSRTGDAGLTPTVVPWAAAGGTANVITGTFTPTITTLTDGLLIGVRFASANSTTTPTFQADATTARTITQLGGTALAVGSIPGGAYEGLLRYNLANTRWEMLNPAVSGGGWKLLNTQTVSNVAQCDITANIDATYKHYMIKGSNVLTIADNSNFWCRFQSGGSFITTALYNFAALLGQANTSAVAGVGATAQTQITLQGSAVGTSNVNPQAFEIHFSRPELTTQFNIDWVYRGATVGTVDQWVAGEARHTTLAAAITGFRFFSNGTNISGTFDLYGMN